MDKDDQPVLTRPLSARQLMALDVVASAGYTLFLVATVSAGAGQTSVAGAVPAWMPYLVVLAIGLPLAARRLWPLPIFVIVFGASLIALGMGVVRDGFVGAGFALYMVAVTEDRSGREPTRLIALASLLGVLALVAAGSPLPVLAEAGQIVVGAVVLGGSWTIGRAVRERRRFAQRSAAQLVERAVAEERLRIARDLHDIVAHGLSLIVVRAATANHVIASRPNEARAALEVIETTGRDALADMRRMLDVLRGDPQTGDDGDLAPVPTLDQLPALVDRVAMAGVRVDCDLSGAEALSDGVAVAVYRIVQEALTNVVKHAAPTRCRLRISVTDEDVQVEVTDEGMRAAIDGSGQRVGRGLVGMQERVRALGGVLEAGPLLHGGFRVFARFPSGATKGAKVSA